MKSLEPPKSGPLRTVITGMGVISPLGTTLTSFHQALLTGQSAITHWLTPKKNCRATLGGDLSSFNLHEFLKLREDFSDEHKRAAIKLLRSTPLAGRMACMASLNAYYHAGKPLQDHDRKRFGCVLGGHHFNLDYGYQNSVVHRSKGHDHIEPLFSLLMLDNDVLASVSELLQIKGPGVTIGNSYISSHQAVLMGESLIRMGRADLVLVSAASQHIDPMVLDCLITTGTVAANALNGNAAHTSRPFDLKRQGFVPSHGAAALILERLDHAKKRKAVVYAELLGGATSTELNSSFYTSATHKTNIMKKALNNAGINRDQVDYIHAHADSTPIGDVTEVAAIKHVFGKRAQAIPINATKSMQGHSLTAAGMLECLAIILQIQENKLYPTINLDTQDPECNLNVITPQSIDHVTQIALSNSYGFYGTAASILLGRIDN